MQGNLLGAITLDFELKIDLFSWFKKNYLPYLPPKKLCPKIMLANVGLATVIEPFAIGLPTEGDEFVLVALEEATKQVDEALEQTVEQLFNGNSTASSHLVRLFRYPPETERGLARAAEIYDRTLYLVGEKVKSQKQIEATANFSYNDLLSPVNLEVVANLSGCEAHRAARDINCTQDMCFHAKYRTVDGTCNNLLKPNQGASLTAFKRNLPASYQNHFNTPQGWDPDELVNGHRLPSARLVSSELISSASVTQDDEISHMVMQWGQFLDHDLSHSMEAISRQTFENGITCSATCDNKPPCFPIKLPGSSGCMEFTRSSATCGSGATSVFTSRLQQRQQLNQLTSYIDASQVYGSSLDLAISLRNLTNDKGRLREGPSFNYGKPLLPFNTRHVVDCRRDPRQSSIGCFLAGDVRANEQLGLTSMHTLWFRHHNFLAEQLRQLNPHWDGDQLYEEARKILGAQMQHITFHHWLPLILGQQHLKPYSGYKPEKDASVSNVFAASAFRFGHALVQPVLRRLNSSLEPIPEGDLPLHQAFFAPWRLVQEGGIDPIIRGLFASHAKKNLPHQLMNTELTEKLFEAVHSVALDLAALNIQRGRDHGLPSYVQWRKFCKLDPEAIADWPHLGQVINDRVILEQLRRLYGHPSNIDLWVGGLLERPEGDARVGPTVKCLIGDQFERLRDGDRFWYENPSTFSPAQLAQIKQTSLARIICDNADDIRQVYPDVFKLDKSSALKSCEEIPQMSLIPWHDIGECQARPPRVKRSSTVDVDFADPAEDRVEGLEVVIAKNKLQMAKMKRRLGRMYKVMVQFAQIHRQDDLEEAVCIDPINGSLRNPGEAWIHQSPTTSASCAKCICQVRYIKREPTLTFINIPNHSFSASSSEMSKNRMSYCLRNNSSRRTALYTY